MYSQACLLRHFRLLRQNPLKLLSLIQMFDQPYNQSSSLVRHKICGSLATIYEELTGIV